MKSKMLADRMKQLKNSEEEMSKMCKEVEKYAENKMNNVVLNMLKRGKMTVQEIAEDCAVTLEHVIAIAKKNNINIA